MTLVLKYFLSKLLFGCTNYKANLINNHHLIFGGTLTDLKIQTRLQHGIIFSYEHTNPRIYIINYFKNLQELQRIREQFFDRH